MGDEEQMGTGKFWYRQGITDALYVLSKCRYAYENDLKIYPEGSGMPVQIRQSFKTIDYCIKKVRELMTKEIDLYDKSGNN